MTDAENKRLNKMISKGLDMPFPNGKGFEGVR